MRTSNPALSSRFFNYDHSINTTDTMTINGTVNKTAILLMILTAAAGSMWIVANQHPSYLVPLVLVGVIGGLITSLVTLFKPHVAPTSTPIYAAFEGLFIGGVSAMLEFQYPGIVIQAVSLTFGTLCGLLLGYKSGAIRVTDKFRKGLFAATSGIALVYVISFIFSLFGMPLGFVYSGGILGIGFSVVVVVIAALNLVLDFDFIEKGAQSQAPVYMEWYAAFGLMITLVWLYIEILRLLSKLRSRD